MGIIYIAVKYCIQFIMPFFAAFLVACILRPLISLAERKLRIKQKFAAVAACVLFYSTIGVLLVLFAINLFVFLKDRFLLLPEFYTNNVEPTLQLVIDYFRGVLEEINPEFAALLQQEIAPNLISSAANMATAFSAGAVALLTGFAMSIPGILLNILFTVIATFFMTMDFSKLTDYIMKQFSPKTREHIFEIKTAVGAVLLKYLRSYSLILLVTFAELTLAMTILGVRSPILIALLIAIFDILPVVGVGTILWPWAIISFIQGNYKMAVGLIITAFIIFIVRNIIEPKIIGHSVGLHPLVTLMAMFIGAGLFGIIGLFGLPITLAILKDLNDKGVIKVFKK